MTILNPLNSVEAATGKSRSKRIAPTILPLGCVGLDREVRYPVASDAPSPLPKQRGAPIEGMTYTDSLTWITRDASPTGTREGVVDMRAYGTWLQANYGINAR